nr:hypothetical protein [uncultured Anaerocolumna sp.]
MNLVIDGYDGMVKNVKKKAVRVLRSLTEGNRNFCVKFPTMKTL